jgi:predicted phage terminase large subunit-like protein
MAATELRPQEGPQEQFLSTSADIAILGGAAGGGKSFGLLMEALRHGTTNPAFAAVLFRRTLADAKKPGGTWDQTVRMYGELGARPRLDNLSWQFQRGGKLVIGHLEHEGTVLDWQGAEVPLLLFDELTHFSKAQFFYMLSRNRSMCGVRPYVRATCNPDADSWVAEFIAWWIDQTTGLAIPERSGVIRWFIRQNDSIIWGDSREELLERYGSDELPKSVTFIAATIYDNKKLMEADPGYLANLKALPLVEQQRLLGGNWKIRPAAGLYFQRSWCEVVDAVPAGLDIVRYWDLAATEKTENNDPDWTVGLKMGKDRAGLFYILDMQRMRESPGKVEKAILNTASADGKAVRLGLPQDPGQAGKSQAAYFVRQFVGFNVKTERESGDKVTRFGPFSAQALAGNVKVLRAAWNSVLFDQLEGFPDASHDDEADACSGGFEMLNTKQAAMSINLRSATNG